MLPSEVPRLATDLPVRVFPGVWKLLSFLRLASQDISPSLRLLALFLSFIFFPTSFRRKWAAFLGAWCLCQHSEVVLWNLLSVQMFFWWICGGESGLPILFLRHLRTANTLSISYIFTYLILSAIESSNHAHISFRDIVSKVLVFDFSSPYFLSLPKD